MTQFGLAWTLNHVSVISFSSYFAPPLWELFEDGKDDISDSLETRNGGLMHGKNLTAKGEKKSY